MARLDDVFLREFILSRKSTLPRILLAQMPPGHGKSMYLSKEGVPPWILANYPWLRIGCASNSRDLAERNAGKTLEFIHQHNGVLGIKLNPKKQATKRWETTEGGGVFSVGMGGSFTGWRRDVILIDDPVKSRKEVSSASTRQDHWEWFCSVAETRLEPNALVVVLLTRWHEDDLAGRLIAQHKELGDLLGSLTVVSLPAVAETPEHQIDAWGAPIPWADGVPPGWSLDTDGVLRDEIGRAVGDPLNPERFPIERLRAVEARSAYTYSALYQQRPRGDIGAYFDRAWFQFIDKPIPQRRRIVRRWDFAATEAKSGGNPDWTVGTRMSEFRGDFFIEDVVRFRGGPGEVERRCRATAEADGKGVTQVMEQEPGASGKQTADHFIRRVFRGFRARAVPSSGDKVLRAGPFSAAAEAGLVFIVRANWNGQLLDELHEFPGGTWDDQVDTCSGAHMDLTEHGPAFFEPGSTPVAPAKADPLDGLALAEQETDRDPRTGTNGRARDAGIRGWEW